jgi:trehalose 6-phosphate synthase
MPLQERIERWQTMFENVREQDVVWWRQRFTAALIDSSPQPPRRSTRDPADAGAD